MAASQPVPRRGRFFRVQDLRVLLVQPDVVWHNAGENLSRIESVLSRSEAADLIVLPEMFTTGFTMEPALVAESPDGRTFDWMRGQAAAHDASVVGSVVVAEHGAFYNRLLWVRPDGSAESYDKHHLFRMSGEHERYVPGGQRLIVDWRGWRVCPLVCYELRFPVWSRNVYTPATDALAVDLLVYVANWPASRAGIWRTLLAARAIENSCYSVGVNRVGVDGNDVSYSGNSGAFSPTAQVLDLDAEIASASITLSRRKLDEYRRTFPAHLDADAFQLDQ